MINWFVGYKIGTLNPQIDMSKVEVISGPYPSELIALAHAQDIGGYEGVFNCRVYAENADELLDKSLGD